MLATYNAKLVEGSNKDFKILYGKDDRALAVLPRDSTDPDFFERSRVEVDIKYKADGFGRLIRILHKGKGVYPV